MRLDPDKYTLRELSRLANLRVKYDWEHTSALLATLINVNRTDGKTLEWDAFVPYTDEERRERRERQKEAEKANFDPAMRPILREWLRSQYPELNKNTK